VSNGRPRACSAAVAALTACCSPPPGPSPTFPQACEGARLEWTEVVLRCDCSRVAADSGSPCPLEEWPKTLRVRAAERELTLPSGGDVELHLSVRNASAERSRLLVSHHPYAVLGQADGTLGWTEDAKLDCPRAFPGEMPEDHTSEIHLPPGGELAVAVRLHAGFAVRDAHLCGWRYTPARPGRYIAWIFWPGADVALADRVGVVITPP
jgi:hypothetical protein